MSLNIREIRIQKLKRLEEVGMEPFPSKVNRDRTLKEATLLFGKPNFAEFFVKVVGRVMAIRAQGSIIFFEIDDGTAKIQGLLQKGNLIANPALFETFNEVVDIGDILQLEGTLLITKRGENTVNVTSWAMAAKSLLPLPEKWSGLKDQELKLRLRYLDMIFDSELKEILIKKSIFWNSVRSFLLSEGFVEVETPVLENTTGGADARPFVSHHNALDIDVFLRISCGELWQKRLLVAGFNKTFEIGRIFRNEGISPEHAQDYTQMEFYCAYANYEDGMKLVERMYKKVAFNTFGTTKFKIGDFEVDLNDEWKKYDYVETIEGMTGVNILKNTLIEIEKKLIELGVKFDKKQAWNINRATDLLWKWCRKRIAGPGFLVGVPKSMSPLAKEDSEHPGLTERFQPIIAGSELGNGYSELNDPIDQAERFSEQAILREGGDEEAQMFDKDFIEALEYGMPPACGFGLSERVFSFLANKPIRETQTFPLMRPISSSDK